MLYHASPHHKITSCRKSRDVFRGNKLLSLRASPGTLRVRKFGCLVREDDRRREERTEPSARGTCPLEIPCNQTSRILRQVLKSRHAPYRAIVTYRPDTDEERLIGLALRQMAEREGVVEAGQVRLSTPEQARLDALNEELPL